MGWGLGADSSVGENESRVSIGRKREKRGIVAVCSQQKREKKKKKEKKGIAGVKMAVRNQDDEGCDKGQSACAALPVQRVERQLGRGSAANMTESGGRLKGVKQ